jgi:hypothetical protein
VGLNFFVVCSLTTDSLAANIAPMSSAHSVQRNPDGGTISPARRARLTVVRKDPFGTFARAALRHRPRRLVLVSPWLAEHGRRSPSLSAVLEHCERHGSSVIVVTRPPITRAHARALEMIETVSRSAVHLNPALHAKLYVCDCGSGQGVAVVGSANLSATSASLAEISLMVRPWRRSKIIQELSGPVVRGLMPTRSNPSR